MKLLIVRHADPDYAIDSLTPTGWREAELLSDRLVKLDVTAFYVSPLGRAKDTASLTLKKSGHEATELSWLQEFPPRISRPDKKEQTIAWDWLPADWTKEERYYDKDGWDSTDVMSKGQVGEAYQQVIAGFDQLLSTHGYEREGAYYRTVRANSDTIILFCHFGLECVLLSHLLGVSPMVLWHGLCAAPSSVTTLVTEERRKGIAYFRMSSFGDISHLYAAGEQPSFAARFCERFDCTEERHD